MTQNTLLLIEAAHWLFTLTLVLGFLALARQIGLLYRRLPSVGARTLNAGPEIGQDIKSFSAPEMAGATIQIPVRNTKFTLLVFVSPGCTACDGVIPGLKSVVQRIKDVAVVMISFNGTKEQNSAYIIKHQLSIPYILEPDASKHFGVLAAPYSLLIDSRGVVLSKGVTNSLEHLESLIEPDTLKSGLHAGALAKAHEAS